ncbi:L-histidine N(alpha)-methyltransferase [Bordetella genomosp. 13]|uniref:L-histidine N(Alpha)-methyltransferase n=1 Tax=Bordetella genomosp. 13 TaxID=463040 RepID=A0A1W6ZE56_9BORD|nr:L-histidine N(alpha)-methyltransferase [Bordetella genomosp. 13]ARP95562.1 L-histidine N(alpha)-methyltransferase [Bordetella genomosp. 13]
MARSLTSLASAAPAQVSRGGTADEELRAGLMAAVPTISPKYLYDSLGSSLFTAITLLPEYYPTRCEAEILREQASRIAYHVGRVESLIDLGAGDCVKAERLFPVLQPTRYVPIDISADYLNDAVARLRHAHPGLEIRALGRDFSHTFDLPESVPAENRLFFYPGSSIGNLSPDEALALLQRIHALCPGGGLLVGVDRVKPRGVLEPAYDDALGLTGAFNLNMLRHVNTLLGSNFRVEDWRHEARYNETESRVEMHLRAAADVLVKWPGGERHFARGQSIHTECSYKYTVDGFADLLRRAGFGKIQHWSDRRDWFSVFSARA